MENMTVDNDTKSTKESFLIWSGKDFKDFGIGFDGVINFREAIKKLEDKELRNLGFEDEYTVFTKVFVSKRLNPKDEFETQVEFEKRKHRLELGEQERRRLFDLKKEKAQQKYSRMRKAKLERISSQLTKFYGPILNTYLGKQHVQMRYNPEESLFDVTLKNWLIELFFQIKVPRDIAREFKDEVEDFEFLCIYEDKEVITKHKLKVGTKKIQIGINKNQVGVNKIKIGTEVIKTGLLFYSEEPVYEEHIIYEDEPIYEEQPIYEKQIRKEQKEELRIIGVQKEFQNKIFKAEINFDILLEEMKKNIKRQHNSNTDFF